VQQPQVIEIDTPVKAVKKGCTTPKTSVKKRKKPEYKPSKVPPKHLSVKKRTLPETPKPCPVTPCLSLSEERKLIPQGLSNNAKSALLNLNQQLNLKSSTKRK